MIIKIIFATLFLFFIILPLNNVVASAYNQVTLNYIFTVLSNVVDSVYLIKVYYNPINRSATLSSQIVVQELTIHIYLRGINRNDFLRKIFGSIMDKWIKIPLIKPIDEIATYSRRYLSINKYIVETAMINTNGLIEYRDLYQGLLVAGEAIYSIVISVDGKQVDLGYFIIKFQLDDIEPSGYIEELSLINYPSKHYVYVLLIPATLLLALSIGTLSKWRYYMII
ncbi:MAG: hypothetical protein DRO40_04800 [Thermoprotei archaeon]|nr:MAG: hypothetical protein DRO40_04800 [Thermoprotei archaeon]